MKKSVLIIGYGVVGQTIHNSIEEKNNKVESANFIDVCIYDPALSNFGLNSELDYQHFDDRYSSIFLCVPTSDMNSDVDATYMPAVVTSYLETLVEHKYSGFVFIKSTVLFEDIQQYLDKLKIIYWAEFLNDLTAEIDFKKDTIPLLGCGSFMKNDVYGYVTKLFPHIEDIKFASVKEAIHFKFIRNLYLSWKISFWNMIAQHNLIDQRLLQQFMEKYPMGEQMDIASDGLIGFGGKCLPKDAEAFNSNILREKMVDEILSKNKVMRGRHKVPYANSEEL